MEDIMMKTLGCAALTLTCLALLASPSQAQQQVEIDAINRFLDRFAELEDAMDEIAQTELMSKDRVWIRQGVGRRTNQALNTKIQQAQMDALKQAIPEIQFFTDYRDRLIRLYGDGTVAIASLYSYTTAILPPDAPSDLAANLGSIPPQVFTLVLEKRGGDWKVVHVHISDLGG
jgi:hypothetical protein